MNSKREYKNLKDYLSQKYIIQRKIFGRLQRCKTLVRFMVRGEENGTLIHDPFFSMEVTHKASNPNENFWVCAKTQKEKTRLWKVKIYLNFSKWIYIYIRIYNIV